MNIMFVFARVSSNLCSGHLSNVGFALLYLSSMEHAVLEEG